MNEFRGDSKAELLHLLGLSTTLKQNLLNYYIMADQVLRDSSNRIIGKIQSQSNGKMVIRDASNRIKGTYDPSQNKTRDASNRIVGTGNLLTTLL